MEEDLQAQAVSLQLPSIPYSYGFTNNGGFDVFTGVDDNIATLGRVLFYDQNLSLNNSISCGTCHKQAIAFSDNVAFSKGFQNHQTLRNTLAIQNISNTINNSFFAIEPKLFWDGRANFLNTMVLMPIVNHVEMGMGQADDIVARVNQQAYYPELFNKAFGSPEADIDKIASALSSFVSSITSGSTKFDLANNSIVALNGLEEEGRLLFFNKYNCNSCHQTGQLNGYEMGGGLVNIGLETNYSDKGLEGVTNDPADNGKFKIPNLRNIALTAPYMHDGRFRSLDEVLDHYSRGIKDHPSLDARLRNGVTGQPMILNISDHEKSAIIAFLNALTDYSMITDVRFSNPFKVR